MSPFKADTSKSVPDFLPNQIDISPTNLYVLCKLFYEKKVFNRIIFTFHICNVLYCEKTRFTRFWPKTHFLVAPDFILPRYY